MNSRKKFLTKLVAAFASVALIYTAAATVLFFQKTNEINHYRMSVNQERYITQVRDKIDTQLTVALNLIQQMKWNSRLIQYSKELERDYFNITKLHQEIKNMVTSFSNYGLIFSVQKMNDDFVISTQNTTRTALFYNQLSWNEFHVETVRNYILDESAKDALILHNTFLDNKNGKYFTLVKKEEIIGGGQVIFYVSFPTESIIPSLSSEEQSGFAISYNGEFVSVSDSEIVESLHTMPVDLTEHYIDLINHRDGSNYLSVAESKILTKIKYIYLTRMDSAEGYLYESFRDTLYIFVILLIFGMAVISIIATYTYRPYTKMMKIHERLLEITENSKLPVKQMFLRDILIGQLTEEQIQEGLATIEIENVRMPVTVVVLQWKNYNDWTEKLSHQGISKMMEQLHILIRENLKDVSYELLEMDIMRFPIIIFGLESKRLESVLYQLTSSIRNGTGLELMAVIGKPVSSMGQLYESYQDALSLIEYQFTHASDPVITMDQLGNLVDADYYFPLDVEKELITYIVRGKKEHTIKLINKIAAENLKKRHLSHAVLSQLLFSLTSTVNRIMQQLKWTTKDVFSDDYNLYQDLLSYRSKQELYEKIVEVFEKLVDYRMQFEQSGEPHLVNQLFEYIHYHYNTDLGLQDIADHFKLSPGYVGRLFKEKTNVNFKDYLNKYRVDMAKKLLNEEHHRIEDISKMVGCNSVITFSRMFKRYEGISPSEYRKLAREVQTSPPNQL